jgi:hypothetical protein
MHEAAHCTKSPAVWSGGEHKAATGGRARGRTNVNVPNRLAPARLTPVRLAPALVPGGPNDYIDPFADPYWRRAMKVFRTVVTILAFFILIPQTVRNVYVRWFEPRDSVLDKYKQPLKGRIQAAASLDELVEMYEKAHKKGEAWRKKQKNISPTSYPPSSPGSYSSAPTTYAPVSPGGTTYAPVGATTYAPATTAPTSTPPGFVEPAAPTLESDEDDPGWDPNLLTAVPATTYPNCAPSTPAETNLENAIHEWETRSNGIYQLRFYWCFGLALVLAGVVVHKFSPWPGLILRIIGFSEMIYWTTPSYLGWGTREADKLFENQLVFSVLALLLLTVVVFVGRTFWNLQSVQKANPSP